ncbi:hypothetical protein [Longimicrobium sp.]|uniref:hypothetical protein n=1 Tax=Longimicrobium sp. TaxID=2029185 RepID=UPI002E30B17C|nr:hypothetical protein [Longimicrobium sp.]HEX6041395.1 hypothetical protein [Longimicrobium sp.]
MRTLIRSAALLLVLSACAAGGQPGGEPSVPAPADERGAIYAVLLDSMRHHAPGVALKHRYVQVETVPPARQIGYDHLMREVPEATPDLIAAFQAAAEQPADVRALVGRGEVEWIRRDSLAQVMRAVTAPELPRAANLSTTRFSPIGMSPDGRRALVYVYYWCGGLCADQHWALLERQPDGRWTLRRTLLTIIS